MQYILNSNIESLFVKLYTFFRAKILDLFLILIIFWSGVSNRAGHLPQSWWLQWINRSALRPNRRDSHSIRYHCGLWYSEQGTSQCYAEREELHSPNTSTGKECSIAVRSETGYVAVNTHRWVFRPKNQLKCDLPCKPRRTPKELAKMSLKTKFYRRNKPG